MKHFRGHTLGDIQEARPQARSGYQPIQRESWRPLVQPAYTGHRTRKRQMWMRPTDADLAIYEEWIGRRFLDRLSSHQHRNFDLHPNQFSYEFERYLSSLPDHIKQAIGRVIA